jgi:hypothetical protein
MRRTAGQPFPLVKEVSKLGRERMPLLVLRMVPSRHVLPENVLDSLRKKRMRPRPATPLWLMQTRVRPLKLFWASVSLSLALLPIYPPEVLSIFRVSSISSSTCTIHFQRLVFRKHISHIILYNVSPIRYPETQGSGPYRRPWLFRHGVNLHA